MPISFSGWQPCSSRFYSLAELNAAIGELDLAGPSDPDEVRRMSPVFQPEPLPFSVCRRIISRLLS